MDFKAVLQFGSRLWIQLNGLLLLASYRVFNVHTGDLE
jgi:hypothetical protein